MPSCFVSCLGLACALVSVVASTAQAGPIEELAGVGLDANDANRIVLRYANGGSGLVYTRDRGASWELACSSSIDASPLTIDVLRVDGARMWLGTNRGLFTDADGAGCAFAPEPRLSAANVTDIAVDPAGKGAMFVTAIQVEADAGHPSSRLLHRDTLGAWSPLAIDSSSLLQRVVAVRTHGHTRIYTQGFSATAAATVISSSDDAGRTWQTFPFHGLEGTAHLEAVDPLDPDRVVVSVANDDTDTQILLSTDRGKSFHAYLAVKSLSAIETAPDGRAWFGDAGDGTNELDDAGLWFATRLGDPPQKLANYAVRCLGYQASNDTLYVCQRWRFGSLAQDTGSFHELLALGGVQGFVKCGDAADVAGQCHEQLCMAYCGDSHFPAAPVCESYDPDCDGQPRVATLVDAGLAPPKKHGAGCAVLGPHELGSNAWPLGMTLWLFILRALRRVRSHSAATAASIHQ